MRICAAQSRPVIGNVGANVERHLVLAELALEQKANCLIFPELSLTGYEPQLAKQLAISPNDPLLMPFQTMADEHSVVIGVGAPTLSLSGVGITMIVFQPNTERLLYSKQLLDPTEAPLFKRGTNQLVLTLGGARLVPAICYESLQDSHVDAAGELGAGFYLASAAKSEQGLAKAEKHYARVAQERNITVLLANCLGPCHNFVGAGRSAVWNSTGKRLAQLDGEREGIVVFDDAAQTADTFYRQ